MTLTGYSKVSLYLYALRRGCDILSVTASLLGSSHLYCCTPTRRPRPPLHTYNLASDVTPNHGNIFFNPGLFPPFFCLKPPARA